jgi:hypothetical protein
VILDDELGIIHMNPAFQKMFMCTNGILGRRISYLVDADGYEKMASGSTDQYEAIRSKYGKKYHEQLYKLPAEKQYVGLYTDVTKIKFDDKQLDLIKKQTMEQARELLDHQIRFSQEDFRKFNAHTPFPREKYGAQRGTRDASDGSVRRAGPDMR